MRFMLLATLLLLAACQSAPTSTQFSSTSRNALVIVVTPTNMSINRDYLRRVDLASSAFMDHVAMIDVNTFGALENLFTQSNQLNADNEQRSVAISIHEIAPGDYAWIEASRTFGTSNWGGGGHFCMYDGAPVYRLQAGEIVIVRMDYVRIVQRNGNQHYLQMDYRRPLIPHAQLMSEIDQARARYPAIVGDADLAEPVAFIRWKQTETGWFSDRSCAEPAGFEQIEPLTGRRRVGS